MVEELNRRPVVDAEGFFTSQERRLAWEERRPMISRASDLMGPGLGPRAVEITDFNAPLATFNGFYYARPGALNSPDSSDWWMGLVISPRQAGLGGIQNFWTFRLGVPPREMLRRFETSPTSDGAHTFSQWTASGGAPEPEALDAGSLYGGNGTNTSLSQFVNLGGWTSIVESGGVTYQGGSPYGLVVAEDGWYQVNAYVRMNTATSGRRLAVISANGGGEIIRLGDITGAFAMAFNGSFAGPLPAGYAMNIQVWNSVSSNWSNARLSVVRMDR